MRARRILAAALLASGVLAARAPAEGRAFGKRVDERFVQIYQFHGDVLSIVYTFTGSVKAQLRVAAHAAGESAKNLAVLGP